MAENSIQFTANIAENYDKYLGPIFFIPCANNLITHIKGTPKNILEIAAGTGHVTRLLVKKFPDSEITATDINEGMLDVAKGIIRSDKVKWNVVDACEIPYKDNTFDLYIRQFGIMFFPDKQKAMAEAYRVLKPGGTIMFSTWDKIENSTLAKITNDVITDLFPDDPPNFYQIPFSMHDPDEMRSMMESAGFKNISVQNIKLEGYADSFENAVKAFAEGNPIANQVEERDPKALPKFKENLARAIEKQFGSGSFKVPLSKFIVSAEK